MKSKVKKPTTELVDCANALRDVKLETPLEVLEWLIEEGHLHLRELKAAVNCNPTLINALSHRISRAEEKLQDRQRMRMTSVKTA